MTDCARGCQRWRRHLEGCPVPNGSEGVWVSVLIEDDETRLELRAMTEEELRQATGFTLGQYGQFQRWEECRGCQPRPADYGVLCDQCYTRLRDWLTSAHNLAWCWQWLAGDLVPGSSAQGDKVKGTRTPPAAMSVTIHDLRQDILAGLGEWLGIVCGQFHLDGPVWFRHRIDEARRRNGVPQAGLPWAAHVELDGPAAAVDWRVWLPQDAPLSAKDPTTEIQDACRFLAAWLQRIVAVEDLTLAIYEEASRLHRRVKTVAPWEPTARRMDGLQCTVCGREALVRWEGDEHLTCRRCEAVVTRERYDIWSVERESEREAS